MRDLPLRPEGCATLGNATNLVKPLQTVDQLLQGIRPVRPHRLVCGGAEAGADLALRRRYDVGRFFG